MIARASELYIQAVLSIIIAAWKEIRMGASQFFSAFRNVFNHIEETQLETSSKVSQWGADTSAADGVMLRFGSGHSFIPTMDTYPRIGCSPGWLPIHELSTSYIPTILGNQALRQALFLEKVEGFGRVVLENYRLDPKDVMIVISNSGVNAMGIDVALSAREQGLKTVAITSLAHSSESYSRHSSGKQLLEVCDEVIDTCVPRGDALLTFPGFPHKFSATSTAAAVIIITTLAPQMPQTYT